MWCEANVISINVQKTKAMLITTSQKRSHSALDLKLKITVGNQCVPCSDEEKLLGVVVNKNLDWSEQVKQVCNSLKYRLRILKEIRSYLSMKARTVYCNSYILPYLDYCCTIWGNTTQSNLLRLFRLQKYAARLIFDDFVSPSHVLIQKLEWLPVEYRIDYHKLVMVYKSLHGHAPEYMSNLFKLRTKTKYCTRSTLSDMLHIPKFHTELFKKSLVVSGSKLWNSLTDKHGNILSLCSLAEFKSLCFKYLNEQWHRTLANN